MRNLEVLPALRRGYEQRWAAAPQRARHQAVRRGRGNTGRGCGTCIHSEGSVATASGPGAAVGRRCSAVCGRYGNSVAAVPQAAAHAQAHLGHPLQVLGLRGRVEVLPTAMATRAS